MAVLVLLSDPLGQGRGASGTGAGAAPKKGELPASACAWGALAAGARKATPGVGSRLAIVAKIALLEIETASPNLSQDAEKGDKGRGR